MTKNTGMFTFICISQAIFLPFFIGFDVFYSLEVGVGAFTWLFDLYSFVMVVCLVSLISGTLANIGYINAFVYFPAEMVAGCMLFQPALGQLGGVLLGQDKVPGILSLIGGLIITIGFMFSSIGEKQKLKKVLNSLTLDSETL